MLGYVIYLSYRIVPYNHIPPKSIVTETLNNSILYMKITMPSKISEVTLGEYQKYNIIATENPDDENFLAMKMVEIFCHVSFREVQLIPMTELYEIVEHIGELFKQKRTHQKRFTLDNIEFGFINEIERMSMGEYIDISEFGKKIETFHNLMAVLYRPITKTTRDLYEIEKHNADDKYSEMLKEMPLDIALTAQVFFCDLARDLLVIIRHSSEVTPKMKELVISVEKQLLERTGDGMVEFTTLQKETS